MIFVLGIIVSIIWDLIVAGVVVFLFNIIGIPVLAALTFWQVFGLLVVVSLATTRFSSSN